MWLYAEVLDGTFSILVLALGKLNSSRDLPRLGASCMVCRFWECHPGLDWDSSSWFVSLKKSNYVPLSDTVFDLNS